MNMRDLNSIGADCKETAYAMGAEHRVANVAYLANYLSSVVRSYSLINSPNSTLESTDLSPTKEC